MSTQDETETRDGQRIAKVMARAGLCSRRDAEKWIAEGRVVVNGEVMTSPAFNVSEADDVVVDGAPLRAAERTRLFMFHKPKGLVTTARDPEGRPTIFEALPEDLPRVVAVGRLDINTEGLILLTNDGGLARVLELPATGWLRRYRVRAHGEITQEQLDALRDGVSIDGVDYRGIEARFERQQGSNVWITMGLREGKNREIKRVLEHLGMSVNRLIRVSFGPFELADLPEGEVMEVRTRVLRDQLGIKLAKQAGVDFEGAAEPEPRGTDGGDLPQMRPRQGDASEGPPRKRKHVSVLRAESREEGAGPRKRITRTATADRKGRAVQVERVSLARPAEPVRGRRPAAAGEEPTRTRTEGGQAPRRSGAGERPEARERPATRPGRPPHTAEGASARPPRRFEGSEGSRFSRAPRSAEGASARPPRRSEGTEGSRFPRVPRAAEGASARPPRRSEGTEGSRFPRPPRSAEGASARPPRRSEGAEGSRFPRPPRSAEGASARPPRRSEGAEGSRFPRAPRSAEGASTRPPRRSEGAEGSRFPRAPRSAESASARPPRRSEGAEGSRFPRTPRSAEGGPARPPRRAEGAEGSRFSRSPRPAGGAPERASRGPESRGKGGEAGRPPRGARPPGKGRPSGGPSRGPGGKGPGGKGPGGKGGGGPRRPRDE
jgi:23S rRNA pseudouridine2605 synthase